MPSLMALSPPVPPPGLKRMVSTGCSLRWLFLTFFVTPGESLILRLSFLCVKWKVSEILIGWVT